MVMSKMNTKNRRLKKEKYEKSLCSCEANYETRTIFVCKNCQSQVGVDIIKVDPKDRIGK